MKKAYLFIFITVLFVACQETIQHEIPEPQHFVLEDVLDHLPFEQFNAFSKVIFRNSSGEEIEYNLSIDEDVVERSFAGIIYSTNEIKFIYSTAFIFEIPSLAVIGTLDYIPTEGYRELIKCGTTLFNASIIIPKLTIIPNENHNNTVLNKEFLWMGETFANVYSNVNVQESEFDKSKVFYNSTMGIIGFLDNTNKSWVLDRFE